MYIYSLRMLWHYFLIRVLVPSPPRLVQSCFSSFGNKGWNFNALVFEFILLYTKGGLENWLRTQFFLVNHHLGKLKISSRIGLSLSRLIKNCFHVIIKPKKVLVGTNGGGCPLGGWLLGWLGFHWHTD